MNKYKVFWSYTIFLCKENGITGSLVQIEMDQLIYWIKVNRIDWFIDSNSIESAGLINLTKK